MSELDPREFRNALGRFATGITVITVRGKDGQLEGLTANSFTALSLQPPLILWCLDKTALTLPAFERCDAFAVNVLRSNQLNLSQQFATPAKDKFTNVDWTEGLGGAPLIADCLAYFECRNHGNHCGGDHIIFIGRVIRFSYSDGQPLLFNAGQYSIAADHPGKDDRVGEANDFMDLHL